MFPGWMRWLFIGLVAYLIYLGSQAPTQAPRKPTNLPTITQENYPALAQTFNAQRWQHTLNPDQMPERCGGTIAYPVETMPPWQQEMAAGDGAPAACGDVVRAKITVWGSAGRKQAEAEVTLTLGNRSLAAGIDQLLVGMRAGAVRVAVLPPAALVRGKADAAVKMPPALRAALPAGKTALLTVERLAD